MRRIVIVGASAAGASAAEAVRRLDRQCHITLVSDEPVPLYSRCLLSDYLLGQVGQERLSFLPADWPRSLGADVLHEPAVELNLAARHLVTRSGRRVPYDRLLVATGASPLQPQLAGGMAGGVHALYRLDQVDAAMAALSDARRVVVMGAGKVGVKAAEAVATRGLPVTLVERAPHLLPGTLDHVSADWVAGLLANRGIGAETGSTVVEVLSGNGRVDGVVLDTGQRLACDLLLIALGGRPNADLARQAGIRVRGGLLVDAQMQTSAQGVYAAGDVARAPLSTSGSQGEAHNSSKGWVANWWNAVHQGRVAGRNMAGERVAYGGSVRANAFRLAGLPVISVGDLDRAGDESLRRQDREAQVYRSLVFRKDRLVGMLQVGGSVADAGILSGLVKSGASVAGLQESLSRDGFSLFASQRGRKLLAGQLDGKRP
jgi:nitrite reductase (NADH) large subunit